MPLNNAYDEQAVIQAIASALETFYGTLIEKIDGLNIQKVMKRKNPYLYRAKAMQSATEIVDSVLTAFVSSSEETIFGNCFFEPIAIAASGGNKALAEGIDIMIQNNETNTISAIAVKSGPSVFNADSKKRQEQNFTAASKLAQQAKARYSVLKENPDLVVLDDPISSFDGNKKFAIINMLFMGKHSLKNRTVLLLTHEFNTVIDAIYNMPYNFNPTPTAAFLTTKQGILQEKEITKADIKSFGEIAHANISSDMDSLNKLVYLRRLLEIENASGLAWQLLSNIFHKREKPEYHFSNGTPNRLMTPEEIQDATNEIKTNYISDFDYDTEYQKTQDITVLKELYQNSGSNYEKLQIYRIMFNENSSNSVIKKFVNEAFHIENDYLFQLNPCEYDTVPQYIIDECDKDILEICPQG